MSETTKIEWTSTHNPDGTVTPGSSWNPIIATRRDTGKRGWHCEKVSPACDHCYAAGMNKRSDGLVGIGTGLNYAPDSLPKVDISLHEKTLLAPLKWKRGRKIFPCSMTDAFGDWVSDEMLVRMVAVAALCQQHDFQFLTKRPGRAALFFTDPYLPERIAESAKRLHAMVTPFALPSEKVFEGPTVALGMPWKLNVWPLPNAWIGVTAESQEAADLRIPILLRTPAAVRFVSVEPMLGTVDPTRTGESASGYGGGRKDLYYDALRGSGFKASPLTGVPIEVYGERLDWIIAGGESGHGARPTHPDWFRGLRDQCQAAGVAFHFKQWGNWQNGSDMKGNGKIVLNDGRQCDFPTEFDQDTQNAWPSFRPTKMANVGKKAAGRLLDGRTWDEFPAVKT